MHKIELTRKSEIQLDNLKNNDIKLFTQIINEIKNLKDFEKLSNIKNIGNSIFRKRVGRWRILFTLNLDIITIWIIDIEKDTKKDYSKWKNYIISQLKGN